MHLGILIVNDSIFCTSNSVFYKHFNVSNALGHRLHELQKYS